MTNDQLSESEILLLQMVPEDGKAIGNKALQEQFKTAAIIYHKPVGVGQFDALRKSLLDKGFLVKGKGRK